MGLAFSILVGLLMIYLGALLIAQVVFSIFNQEEKD